MELSNIKINGCTVNVIFDGTDYFFYSNYYGLICNAARDLDNNKAFTISAGNRHTIGTRFAGLIIPAVKRFIRKSENSWTEKNIIFRESGKNVDNEYLKISVSAY